MRELTPEECEFIAGGRLTANSSSFEDEVDEIVVVGSPPPYWPPPYWPPPYYPPPYYPPPSGGGGGPTTPPPPPPPPPDDASNDVDVKFQRPLTPDEAADLQALKDSVMRADNWVNNLPDDAQLQLDDGNIVTGAEIKAAWANTDFEINEVGTPYANGSGRGEADYNNGNPVVRLNIDNVGAYNDLQGGTDYLVLHEVAHLTVDQRTSYDAMRADGTYTAAEEAQHERMANDIARGVISYFGGTVMANPGFSYSPSNPGFQTPPPPPPPPPPPGTQIP